MLEGFGLSFVLAQVVPFLQGLFEVFHGFEVIVHCQLVVVHFLRQLRAALVFHLLVLVVDLRAMVAVLIRVY